MKYIILKRSIAFILWIFLLVGMLPPMQISAEQEIEILTATRADSALMQTVEALRNEIDKLPTTGALRNGKVRLNAFSPSTDGKNDMKGLKGKHYIIREEGDGFYALDGSWTGTNGNLPMKKVTMSAGPERYYIVSGINPAMAFSFHDRGIASNGMPAYVLRFNNGRNLGVGSRYNDWKNLYYVKGDTTTDLTKAPRVRLYHPKGVGWFTIRNVEGTHGLRQASDLTGFRWKDNSAGDNDFEGNVLEIYRLWSTREIIDAIHDMRGYLDTPEFFDEEVFAQFLTCMRESVELFRKYNPRPSAMIEPYEFVQESLDQKEAELRSFADHLTIRVEEPSAAELNSTTKIHQLPIACGYVIQTRGGKIIVIDGGYQDNNTEGKYLFSYLQKITGKSKPHIDAWFLTHAHADHHGCVPTFSDLYRNQVTIDAFYYHYPTYDQIAKYLPGCGVDSTWASVDWVRSWLMPNFRNSKGGPTEEVALYTDHSGKCNNSFDFDEVHIDILVTFDDIMWAADNVKDRFSATSQYEGCNFSNMTFKELLTDNFNETSTIFRISAGGKNLLITGDTNLIGGYMLEKYHDAHAQNSNSYFTIKSDYVQVSHHGYCGLAKRTYQKIDADVALFPTNSQEYNDTGFMNLVWHRRWFDEMGAKSIPAYQGPQVIEFPVVRSGGMTGIPAELKSYVFNAEYYSAKYEDLAKLYGTDESKLYYHFLRYGLEEGRSASPFFDVKFYANQNGAHLRDTFKGNYGAAYKDFLSKYKTTTLLKLSEEFDASFYASNHRDLSSPTNFSLLQHYVANGYKIGEIASNTFITLEPNVTYHDNCIVTQPVAATCTTAGKTGRVECKSCGLVLREHTTVSAGNHSYSYKVSKEPTTSASGTLTGTCALCSGTTTVTLPKLNTTDYTKTTTTAPTCTTGGTDKYTWKTTTYGTFSFNATVAKLGHNHTATVTAPTCTAKGYTTHTCTRCADTYTDTETAALGHAYSYKATKNPTTSATGTLTGTCSRCSGTTTLTLPKLNTTDYTKTTTTAPTCTTGGTEKYTWKTTTYGTFTFTASTAALSHSYTTKVTAPTCTAEGYTIYTCSRCSHTYKDNYVNAKGHTEVIDKAVAATCTTTGKTEGKHCSVCNVVLVAQQTIPATGHSDTTPADNRCDICGDRIKEAVLRFRTISLKGNIAINYYMDLSDEVAADENAYMLFTMEDGEQIKVPASEGEYSMYQNAYYYSFSCAVSAKEMTDKVICQFFWSGGQTEAYTYSVKTYADRILASNSSAKLRNLIYAMLNYGAASQIHFEYHTERLANAGQEVPDYTQITIDGYPVNTKQGTTLATYAGASLLLTSETTLRIFFTVDSSIADQFAVTYKGEVLPLGIRSGKYYADIHDIGAKDLDEYFTLTIFDGTETAEVSYSPLSYCASVIENAKGIHDRELQDVAAAMYLYNNAANAYFLK